MYRRQLIFTILFCVYLKIFYFNITGMAIDNFYAMCAKNSIIISQMQSSIFGIIAIVYYFFSIAVIVGLFAYWFRHFRVWIYLLFGFLIRYTKEIFVLLPLVLKGETSFFVLLSEPEIAITFSVELLVTFLGSYFGWRYGRGISYLDIRDKREFTFWGLSKRLWCLIVIAFNPILLFLSRYSIVSIYEATKEKDMLDSLVNIFNIQHGGRLFRILMLPLMSCMSWALAFYAFYVALKAVKDKGTRYRYVKIVCILILLPAVILIGKVLALARQGF